MLFIKKIFALLLIFCFFSQFLSATPFYDGIKEYFKDDIIDIGQHQGTPVRVSSGSNSNEFFYVSQPRARQFLGMSVDGKILSSQEEIKPYSSQLLSRTEWQEHMQRAVVRAFSRTFFTPPMEEHFVYVSGVILCLPCVDNRDVFENNLLSREWIENNQQYLKLDQKYALFLSKYNPKSVLVMVGDTVIPEVDQRRDENPYPWVELFMGPRSLKTGTPVRDRFTAFALMSSILHPTLKLKPDFEQRREGPNIFNELEKEDRTYNYLAFQMDPKIIMSFLKKDPEKCVLDLFTLPLTFEAQLRFSVLRDLILEMKRIQESLKGFTRGTQISIGSFLKHVQNTSEALTPPSPWAPASMVYAQLLRALFDFKSDRTTENVHLLNTHLREYGAAFAEKRVPFAQETKTKAPLELQFGSRMNEWFYALLTRRDVNMQDALLWAIYFGFDINYRPSSNAPSLLMYYVGQDSGDAITLLLKYGAYSSTHSPVDKAIELKHKNAFRALLGGSERISLVKPGKALEWYNALRNTRSLDDSQEQAFRVLAAQDPYFAWLRFLNQFLAQKQFSQMRLQEESAESQEAQHKFLKLFSTLEQEEISDEGLQASLEKYSFDYFLDLFGIKEMGPLGKRVRKILAERYGRLTLEDAAVICPGVAIVDDFYHIEMMRRHLEEEMFRMIPFTSGEPITIVQARLKSSAIDYLRFLRNKWKNKEVQQPLFYNGFLNEYYLPEQMVEWLRNSVSKTSGGVVFRPKEGAVVIHPCEKWVTSEMAAHVFTSTFFQTPGIYEGLKIGSQYFAFFPAEETLEDFEVLSEENGLRLKTSSDFLYRLSSESFSRYFISLLLLMPQSHERRDVLVLPSGNEMHLFLGGRHQGFFQTDPFNTHLEIQMVAFWDDLKNSRIDQDVLKSSKDLNPDEVIVDWMMALMNMQSHVENVSEYPLPISHKELGALYLRLHLLKNILNKSDGSLTHGELFQRMNPWKAYALKPSKRINAQGMDDVLSEVLTLPFSKLVEEQQQRADVFMRLEGWMKDPKMGGWFGDWAAFFQGSEEAPMTSGSILDIIAKAETPSSYVVIPSTQEVQREDLESLFFQGVSFLSMQNQRFKRKENNPSAISEAISYFLSSVSQSRTLVYLNIAGFGVQHLLSQVLKLEFQTLETLYLDEVPMRALALKSPHLRVLSLRKCASLKELNLDTPQLRTIDLTAAYSFTDESFNHMMENLSRTKRLSNMPPMEKINLGGTKVSFSEFRELSPDVSAEDFIMMTKRLLGPMAARLSDIHLEDFLEGKARLRTERVCGSQDAVDQIRSVLLKTAGAPLRDARKVLRWGWERWQAWRSPDFDMKMRKRLETTDLLKAPIGTPLVAGGYFGFYSVVIAHPLAWGAIPLTWWVGGSVKSVLNQIEEGKHQAEVLLGRTLARSVMETGRTSVNFKGIGFGVPGLISFFMEGGVDKLHELNLENNDLGDRGGECLREFFASGRYSSLTVKLGGNGINWGLLSEIEMLTKPQREDQIGNTLTPAVLVEDETAVPAVISSERGENVNGMVGVLTSEPHAEAGQVPLSVSPSRSDADMGVLEVSENAEKSFFGLHINGAVGPIHTRTLITLLKVVEDMLQSPLKDFFHGMGGSNAGGLMALTLSVPPSTSRFSLFKPVPSSLDNLEKIIDTASSQFDPNYNLNGQEPLFSWSEIASTWEGHFGKRSIKDALVPLVVTLEKRGAPFVVTDDQTEDLPASRLAAMLTHLPWPYHVGASLRQEEHIYGSSDIIINTSPQMLVEEIKRRFSGAQEQNIYVLSFGDLIVPQELRNMERNGGKVVDYLREVPSSAEPDNVFHFSFRGGMSWANPQEVYVTAASRTVFQRAFKEWFTSKGVENYLRKGESPD